MAHTTGTGKYEALLERCRTLEPVPTAVAHPCEETALAGALEAGAKKLITPILVGPAAKIREVAKLSGRFLGSTTIVDVPQSPRGHRRGHQHCAGTGGQGAHLPERD